MKNLTYRWKNLTVEIVRELHQARAELSSQGARTDLVTNVTKSWNQYVSDCGIERMTAHRWLERYIPEQDKLLSTEEYQEIKQIEDRKRLGKAESIQIKVNGYIKTGKKPTDWDSDSENELHRREKVKKNADEKYEKFKKENEQRKREREQKEKQEKIDYEKSQKEHDDLLDNLYRMKAENNENKEIKESLRLSNRHDNLSQEVMIETIDDYINSISDNQRGIETAQNLIKYLRNKIAKMQVI